MFFEKFVRFIAEPHLSVVNPITRQVCRYTALLTLCVLPVPLLLYLLRQDIPQSESNFTPEIHIVATVSIFLSYIILRTRYFRVALFMQVLLSAMLPLTFSLIAPSAYNDPQIIVISIILAAIFFGKNEVLGITLFCNLGLCCLLVAADTELTFIVSKTAITVNVCAMLVYFLRGHQSWLAAHRDTELSDQLKRYRHLASSSFDGIATLQDGKLIEVSEGFADVFRLSTAECTGKRLIELLPQFNDSDSHLETYAIGHPNAETETRYALLAVNRVDKNRCLLALRDTTNEQRRQVQQLQMDRMTATGTLASGIAHELNTPLMVAMNQARIAMSELEQNQLQELPRRLSVLDEVLGQIATIVSDLKWYVLTASDDEKTPSHIVIEKAVRLAKHRIRHHCTIQLELKSESTTELPDHSLMQLLTNLLFNAADARGTNQEYNSVRVRTRNDAEYLYIEISDNGVGMSQEVKQRIFEPFFSHGKGAGSGLGLSICESLVSRVNGKIEVETSPGNGCTFTLTLPIEQPLAQPESPSIATMNSH